MYNDTTTSYKINENEVAYNVDKETHISPGTIKMYIPKLMANIPMGIPKTSKGSINKGIFMNDGSCKVYPSNTITTQNYITIPKWPNESPVFPSKADGIPYYPRMTRYNKFMVEITNGDIRNMHYSGKV